MIKDLVAQETVTDFFLVRAATIRTANNNRLFVDLELADKSGTINAKIWEVTGEIEKLFTNINPAVVKIRGLVTEYQGKLQLKVDQIRAMQDSDGVNIDDLVPTAPYPAAAMLDRVRKYISEIKNPDIQRLVSHIVESKEEKLLYYPAAKSNHHSIRSGLLYHVLTMLRVGEQLTAIYEHLNRDLVYAGIILHDLAKIEEMNSNELGIVADYSKEGKLLGHIIQGVKEVELVAIELGTDPEVRVILQHMILSHHYHPEFGSPKAPMIPEAELVHFIDMIDSRVYDMREATADVEAEGFSDRVWSLENRQIYKPNL